MKNRLGAIIEYKRREVESRMAAFGSTFTRDALIAPATRGFRDALLRKSADGWPALIAEIKKASPSAGVIRNAFDPPALARAYQAAGAACLSVLTDAPSFQGSEAHLRAARAACELPVLRKDFMVDPWQVTESRAIGADAVLVILAALDDDMARAIMEESHRYGMDVLVECHDAEELDRAVNLGADLIGVNNRDLKTFKTDLATAENLLAGLSDDVVGVAESGIKEPEDVARMHAAGGRAILVGESLMRQADVEAAARTILQRPADA